MKPTSHGPNFEPLFDCVQQYQDGCITALEFRNKLLHALMELPEDDLLVISDALAVELEVKS